MKLRARVLLAMAAVALVAPATLLVVRERARAELAERLAAREAELLETRLELVEERLAGALGPLETFYELLRAEDALDEDALSSALGPEPRGRRETRAWRAARARIARLARAAGLDAWLVLDARGRPLLDPGALAAEAEAPGGGKTPALALPPREPGYLAPGVSWWEWHPTLGAAGLLAKFEARAFPPARLAAEDAPGAAGAASTPIEALFVGARLVTPEGLATELAPSLGVDPTRVTVQPRLPGAAAEPDEAMPAPRLEATIGGAGFPPAARLLVPRPAPPAGPAAGVDRLLLLAAALGLGSALLLGVVLARNLTRPLVSLAERVDEFGTERSLDEPLPRGPGEIGALAGALERLLVDLRSAERGRAAAEREAAWSEVARRVAHEVKNPLTPIRLAADNLERARRRGAEALDAALEDELAAIRHEVRRLERLVAAFSRYASLPAPELAPTDVVALARRVVGEQVRASGAARLVEEVDEELPRVQADAELLAHAFENVARNALEAMAGEEGAAGEGPPLRLWLRARLEPDPAASAGAGGDRGWLVVELADEGPGIPDELRARIFEPYVSAREGGTGLGLAIAERIVREQGGSIEACPGTGGGACFRFVFADNDSRLPEGGARRTLSGLDEAREGAAK